jgi:hypothetical protein
MAVVEVEILDRMRNVKRKIKEINILILAKKTVDRTRSILRKFKAKHEVCTLSRDYYEVEE